MEMKFFWLCLGMGAALFTGYYYGLLKAGRRWRKVLEEEKMFGQAGKREHYGSRKEAFRGKWFSGYHQEKARGGGDLELKCPVDGEVKEADTSMGSSVSIRPYADLLCAPCAGKIVRIGPIGNEIVLKTETGAQVYMHIGSQTDEMSSRLFRPRVIGNEVVDEGKVLLQFDRKELLDENASIGISIHVEAEGEIEAMWLIEAGKRIGAGQSIMKLRIYPKEEF